MKRLRRDGKRLGYYVGGEYGDQLWRPHFHACLFGWDFPDKSYFKKSSDGSKLYTSQMLDEVWGMGMTSVGSVNFASAAYIARYCMQKRTGPSAKAHYEFITDDGEIIQRTPEFNHMSLKPAVGLRWLQKYMTDVYPRDYVVVNGVKTKPPAYYDEVFKGIDPLMFDELRAMREADAELVLADNSYSRLAVKEAVVQARTSLLKRSL
jgi:hypothetical protein